MAAANNDGRLLFQRAAEGKRGEEALLAIGDAYIDEMVTDPIRLPGQIHIYVASTDPEIREVVRIGYGDLVAYAEQVSGLSPSGSRASSPQGMLLSVLALMQVQAGRSTGRRHYWKAAGGPVEASAPDPLLMGAMCGKSLPKDAATLAGSPVARQRARVTRSSTRAANRMCGERQACRSSNGHA
jgi:hypothetical protein